MLDYMHISKNNKKYQVFFQDSAFPLQKDRFRAFIKQVAFYTSTILVLDIDLIQRENKLMSDFKIVKIDHRKVRSSKISKALKRTLVDTVLIDGISIKKAAQKLKINYSTAKVIFQRYKTEKQTQSQKKTRREQYKRLNLSEDKESLEKLNRCCYKKARTEDSPENSETTETSRKISLFVVSTVGWNYMKQGLPSLEKFQKKNKSGGYS